MVNWELKNCCNGDSKTFLITIVSTQIVIFLFFEAMFADLGHFSVRSIQAKHQRRRQELTQTTPDQPLDDEAVYYKVAGDCPKGCVYSLRSLWRKKRRYVDPDASTSQVLAQRGMSNFMILSCGSGSMTNVALIPVWREYILTLEAGTRSETSTGRAWFLERATHA
ncbi:hypothetical protein Scep_001278 [Stephania cephalantha]|uniref:Uncharacterized protein n=1 Tax=Stephania cephalantha TaxID=152367 RepID=A0AAP0Q372_9MAGN